MARNIITGIDIGTYHVKAVVAERGGGRRGAPKILGTGLAESRGMRHGYIVNGRDVTKSVAAAVGEASRAAGVAVKRAYLSIGGVGLDEARSSGEVVVSRADGEVTDLDIGKAVAASEEKIAQKLANRRILHTIPLAYRIDGEPVLGRPEGMKGAKVAADVLFITCLEQHLNDLIAAVEEAGVAFEDVMAAPIAASFVTLTKAEKIAGCVLANIGAETVSIAVFEDGLPVSVKVFPIGSRAVTHDIALGLRVSLEEAEQIKLGAITGASVSRKKLDEIILARLSDIFDLIEAHLKKLGKSGFLPAGIILTGGGSGVATIEDLARATLKLPSKIAAVAFGEGARIRDASWAVAYGLCVWGFSAEEGDVIKPPAGSAGPFSWLRQFLP